METQQNFISQVQNLLTQVDTITKKNSQIIDADGSRFNLFRIFGVDHYENTHSAIIAELLNPNGTHGLKHKFIQCFVENLNLNKIIDFNFENCIVITEFQTPNGRFDILIRDTNNKAIIIENKIYASDQWEQLKRYDNFAKAEYREGNYLLLYLTLSGNEASLQSSQNVTYYQISYSIDIIEWLYKCVEIAARFPIVRESIVQYINHLKKLTNQDMDAKNKEEIIKLLTKPENIEAAFFISQNMSSIKEDIVNKHFNRALEEIKNELNLVSLEPLKTNVIYSGFGFEVPNWKYFKIYFEFDGSNYMKLGYMLKLKNNEVKCSPEVINGLKSHFKKHNNNSSLPLGWTYMDKYQDWNVDAMKAILSGEMKTIIKDITQELLNLSSKYEL